MQLSSLSHRHNPKPARVPVKFGNTPASENLTPAKNAYQFISNETVTGYAQPLAGSEHLRLYTTPDPTGKFNWMFAHRERGKAAMHVLPIIKDANGREYLHVIIQKSPVMGGRPIVQLPAGLWGDQDPSEGAMNVAGRELKEETGYEVRAAKVLTQQLFATSPGMTTEQKTFAMVKATGTPTGDFREPQEQDSIIGKIDVPLSTIRNYTRFINWIKDLNEKGYTVGMDILAARAVLPPQKQLDAIG